MDTKIYDTALIEMKDDFPYNEPIQPIEMIDSYFLIHEDVEVKIAEYDDNKEDS